MPRFERSRCADLTVHDAATSAQAWAALAHFNPRGEHDGVRKRLVVTRGGNSDAQSYASQLLGVGVGLTVLCKRLGIPYSTISKVNFGPGQVHDFEGQRGRQSVRLEVRGRFRANGRKKALGQVEKKFRTIRDFSQAVAAQVYPDDRARRGQYDVELIDPPGLAEGGGFALERALIRHYAGYLTQQKVDGGDILMMLASVPDERFMTFYRNTFGWIWTSLLERERKRPSRLGRNRLTVGGVSYLGTMWHGWAAPGWARSSIPNADDGSVFMGIPELVYERLGTPEGARSLGHAGEDAASSDDDFTYLRLSDGFLVVWSPSRQLLVNHP